ncbi:hypothetical protein [Aquabacterium sp.]|uniref:hypothetical protein n=1 Tax=Aquabacterium sp. TaxID=1872578 RepID=UPI0040381F77
MTPYFKEQLGRAALSATQPAQSVQSPDDDEAAIPDYQEALASVDALVRRLDVALNGEVGAA